MEDKGTYYGTDEYAGIANAVIPKELDYRQFDVTECDSYSTACPECGAIQDGNDWPPYGNEKFKCYKCGHEYTGKDIKDGHWYTLCWWEKK